MEYNFNFFLNIFKLDCSFISVGSSFYNLGILYFKHLTSIDPREMYIIFGSGVMGMDGLISTKVVNKQLKQCLIILCKGEVSLYLCRICVNSLVFG